MRNARRVTVLLGAWIMVGLGDRERAATAQEAAEPIPLGPIIVQGERRPRSLQDTTTSATVIDEDAIARSGETSVYDVIDGAPNLTPAAPEFLPPIRGVASGGAAALGGDILFGTRPRAILVIDDVARTSNIANAGFNSLWDVEQVELLRGPQTTLRGRNAVAGAYIIRTKDPTFTPEGSALVAPTWDDFGGFDQRYAGAISGPVIADTLALRLSAEDQRGEDDVDIIDQPPGPAQESLRGVRSSTVRGKALLVPHGAAEGLRVQLTAEHARGQTPQFRGFVSGPELTGEPVSRRVIEGTEVRLIDFRATALAARASYDLGGLGEIESISSFTRDRYESDPDQTQIVFFEEAREDIWTQDLIWSFGDEGSRLQGLIGGTVSSRDIKNRTSGFEYDLVGDSRSQAVFADLSVEIAPRLSLLLGGRINRNRDERRFRSLVVDVDSDDSQTAVLPKLGLLYDITPDQSVALTVRRGYNPGGTGGNFALGTTYEFEDEQVWTTELAYRSLWLDERLSLNATAFYNRYEDQQFFLERVAGDPLSQEIVNVPESESYGIEIEARARPVGSLELSAGLGLLRTEITRSVADNETVEGNRFGLDPELTAAVGAVWQVTDRLSADGSLNYVGEYNSTFLDLDDEDAGDYAIVNLGLGYDLARAAGRPSDEARSGLSARLFVDNVLDETAFQTRSGRTGGYVLSSRTVGLAVTASF